MKFKFCIYISLIIHFAVGLQLSSFMSNQQVIEEFKEAQKISLEEHIKEIVERLKDVSTNENLHQKMDELAEEFLESENFKKQKETWDLLKNEEERAQVLKEEFKQFVKEKMEEKRATEEGEKSNKEIENENLEDLPVESSNSKEPEKDVVDFEKKNPMKEREVATTEKDLSEKAKSDSDVDKSCPDPGGGRDEKTIESESSQENSMISKEIMEMEDSKQEQNNNKESQGESVIDQPQMQNMTNEEKSSSTEGSEVKENASETNGLPEVNERSQKVEGQKEQNASSEVNEQNKGTRLVKEGSQRTLNDSLDEENVSLEVIEQIFNESTRVSPQKEIEIRELNKNDFQKMKLKDVSDSINGETNQPKHEEPMAYRYLYQPHVEHKLESQPVTEGIEKLSAVMPHPDFKKGSFFSIPFLSEQPEIDGKSKEWDLPNSWVTTEKQIAMGFNAQGLYFFASIRDKSGKFEGDALDTMRVSMWRFDCIEIWIDMKNSKSGFTGQDNCQQFFFWPAIPGVREKPEIYEVLWKNRFSNLSLKERVRQVSNSSNGLIASKIHDDGKGYDLEVQIPTEMLYNQAHFQGGAVMGFLYIINHGPNKEFEDASIENYVKGYKYSEQPSTWGNAQFLGSDASLQVLNVSNKRVVPAFTPISVEITDHDANQDLEKVEEIQLKVVNENNQDEEVFVAIETNKNTGVFQVKIPLTIANIKQGDQKITSMPGDDLKIVYTEKINARGVYEKSNEYKYKVVPNVYE